MIPEKRPRSLAILGPLAVVAVVVGLAWYVVSDVGGARAPTFECTVTSAGEAVRQQMDVGAEHRPDAVAGDRYRADSGCLAPDDQREVRSAYGD